MNIKSDKKKPFRLTRFRLFYMILLAVLICTSLIFLNYVKESLNLYEAAQPKHFMDGVLDSIRSNSAEELASKMDFPELAESRFNDPPAYRLACAKELLASDLTFSGGTELGSSAVYELSSPDKKLADITIRSVSEQVRLGLMSIPRWELVSIVYATQDTYAYDISVPSIYKVLVNGTELSDNELTGEYPLKGYEYEDEYVQMPVMVSYHVENLLLEPLIVVYNSLGEEVPFEIINNTVELEPVFNPTEFPVDLKEEVNVLEIAKTWSKFLTQDLSGSRYGLNEARAYFIKDSYFWDMAYGYATGVDITFVSNHSLNSFTGESVTDYIRYTDDCFSCVVYFEKNMTLASGAARTDIFNSRLFFVLYDDTDDNTNNPRWLISDMQSITNSSS